MHVLYDHSLYEADLSNRFNNLPCRAQCFSLSCEVPHHLLTNSTSSNWFTMQSNSQSLGFLLQSFLREQGWQDIALEAKVPLIWSELIGENAAKHCTSVSFDSGVLSITVDSSVWRSELRYRKSDLINRMNEHLGTTIVHDISLR